MYKLIRNYISNYIEFYIIIISNHNIEYTYSIYFIPVEPPCVEEVRMLDVVVCKEDKYRLIVNKININ